MAVLRTFCSHLDFADLDFDVAMRYSRQLNFRGIANFRIRQLLSRFRLPGEAQKIDRIMNAFAAHYYTCNKAGGLFKGAGMTRLYSPNTQTHLFYY